MRCWNGGRRYQQREFFLCRNQPNFFLLPLTLFFAGTSIHFCYHRLVFLLEQSDLFATIIFGFCWNQPLFLLPPALYFAGTSIQFCYNRMCYVLESVFFCYYRLFVLLEPDQFFATTGFGGQPHRLAINAATGSRQHRRGTVCGRRRGGATMDAGKPTKKLLQVNAFLLRLTTASVGGELLRRASEARQTGKDGNARCGTREETGRPPCFS